MKPKEQQIAIARACGFSNLTNDGRFGYRQDLCGESGRCSLPDYLKSLDAMHEAEKQCIIAKGLTLTHWKHLYSIVNNEPVAAIGYELDDLISCDEVAANCVYATAAQRAEAFLRTLNLWTS